MRIGYGYNRIAKEFAHANVERLWLDSKHTDRSERADLINAGLRPGDTLVLLAKADLGFGGEIPIIRRALEARKIKVEIAEKPKDTRPKGRPPEFTPTSEQDAKIKALWHDPLTYTGAYVYKRAAEIMGHPVTRYQLNHRYGKREN